MAKRAGVNVSLTIAWQTVPMPRELAEPLPLFPAAEPAGDEAVPVPLPAGGRLPSYIAGHRARLRERFRQGGAEAMPDYELLELLLFRVMERQDVKPVARALLDAFGDLASVLAAPIPRLVEVPGVGPAIALELKITEAVAHRMARARVMGRVVVSSWAQLLEYCRTVMAHRDREQVRVLYLDRKNRLIADEEQGEGTVDHVPLYPREVLRRALELGASALILVHNHPSGDPTPSEADIAMTRQIETGAEALGLSLHDHLVIGRGREISFRAEGLL